MRRTGKLKSQTAFFIAVRYLWGRAREGGRYLRGAAIGIAVSLVPIIVTLVVADGMIRGIIDRYIELGTGHLQVFNRINPDNFDEVKEIVLNEEGVTGAWAEQRSISVLVGKKDKTGATVRAIEPSFWDDSGSAEYLKITAGTAGLESDRDMLLGESLAAAIGAEPGDTVRLMTIRTADGRSIPRAAPFVVKGIVSSGYHDLDALWCIISREGGQRILSPELSSSSLIVKIDDPYKNADDMAWSFYSL
jgi:lipoprotein-releasing system permease protein